MKPTVKTYTIGAHMKKLSDINDGYIQGHIEPKGGECYRCGQMTRVIRITGMSLPSDFHKPDSDELHPWLIKRLIFLDEKGTTLDRIGIGCGCYAKGHRQIAHITSSMRAK